MALDSYSGLKTEIANTLDRDDLTNYVDSFIDLAEARFKREIRIRDMVKRSQATFDERFLALPSGFVSMQSMRILTDPVTVLAELNLDQMNRHRTTTTGTPKFYTVHEEIEFDRVPDSTLTAEMIYFATFSPLSDDNTSNALLTRAPDVYLYGSLIAAEPFLDNDERVGMWAELYKTARDELNMMDRRRGGPLVSRVVGATP